MMKNLPYQQVDITDGFWAHRQQLNRDVTSKVVYDRFDETGRIGAFRFDWKPDMPFRPHIFWDSDVAKWMEGAAYLIAKQPDAELETKIDALVDQIEAHQQSDGYFNIFFTIVEPENRFQLRPKHELYCAGHLIEAAIAYDQATGKRKFLDCMIRYAELIDRVFRVEQSAAFSTPGHEEIELALVRLADHTGDDRWMTLARWFIDTRGTAENDDSSRSNQTHLPVRRQRTAEGHAVRAGYLYSAMADLAARDGDTELADACRDLFDNIVNRRMYITGGIGSTRIQEAFTVDYDLPNATAYTESCAAISLMMFARRMQLLEPDVRYADTIERALYNGFLSSTSLDGRSFFYENPLAIYPERIGRNVSAHPSQSDLERLPITQRVEVFSCSCCPPNILRFMASLGGMLYSMDEDTRTVYCHQYMNSRAEFDFCGEKARLVQETAYPLDGKIKLTWYGPDAVLKLRVPYWVRNFTEVAENGYLTRPVQNGSVIELDFPMEVRFVTAHPRVQYDSARCAVMRGPVVYCMEAVDNGACIRDVRLCANGTIEVVPDEMTGLPAVLCDAYRRESVEALYTDLQDVKLVSMKARLIPYYAFANRGESEMAVWVPYFLK